ncbi:MAG: hypothetical protein R3E50_06935 [Halioglobus sp.]
MRGQLDGRRVFRRLCSGTRESPPARTLAQADALLAVGSSLTVFRYRFCRHARQLGKPSPSSTRQNRADPIAQLSASPLLAEMAVRLTMPLLCVPGIRQ